MLRWSRFVVSSICTLALTCLPSPTRAGDLNPPAGPVTETMKTLEEVEPRIAISADNTPGDANSVFRIDQPGSYYLAANVTAPAGDSAIEIASSNVTVDLNGFALFGEAGSMDGVAILPGNQQVMVRNGSISSFDGFGVQSDALSCTLEHLTIDDCAQNGILLNGIDSNVVRDCVVMRSGQEGIVVGNRGEISRCVSSSNNSVGFICGPSNVVTECIAVDNSAAGFFISFASTVTSCTADLNSQQGFRADNGVILRGCAATANQGGGIQVANGCTVIECSSFQNNATGISASDGCLISSCTVTSNTGTGILVSGSSVVTGCTSRFNTFDGIQCNSDNLITNNVSSANGPGGADGAGIVVIGSDNRIDGNNVSDNDRGIDVDSAGNIIIRNTCSGNATNFDIVANNRYGPILNIPAAGTAAVLGLSAPSTLTTTDPWANFSY